MLAEMLFNFQHTKGFHNCLTELQAGQIESAYASLEMARMLLTQGVDQALTFRFVTPCGIKRRDYDLSLLCGDGVRICAETKCKLEETDITIRTLESSFSIAKRQLPEGAPGIIFLKTPRSWVTESDFVNEMVSLADRVLRRSPHIVSIKFYNSRIEEHTSFDGNSQGEIISFLERNNPSHHFSRWRERNWNMFPTSQPIARMPTENYNGLRASWQRLFVGGGWKL